MAHGGSVPIADVQVGDEVLAYDFETGTTVTREVTATLPHTDWLLEAHFSDGSVMSVTEDHRFWQFGQKVVVRASRTTLLSSSAQLIHGSPPRP